MKDQVEMKKQFEESTDNYRIKTFKPIEDGIFDKNYKLIRSSSVE